MFYKMFRCFLPILLLANLFSSVLTATAQSLPEEQPTIDIAKTEIFLPLVSTETNPAENTEAVKASSLYPSYKIVAVHSGKCLDVRGGSTAEQTPIQQFTCHGGSSQSFSRISSTLGPNGGLNTSPFQVLYIWFSQKCMDVVGGSLADQAKIQQYTCHGGPNEQWYIIPFGPTGNYLIMSKNSGKCMDIPSGSLADGVSLQQSRCHGGTNQQFRFQ